MKKAFKVLAMFLVVASMAALSSCSKKDSIVGKWQYASASIEIASDIPEVQEYISQYQTLMNVLFADMVWEFKEDGSLVVTGSMVEEEELDERVTYSVNGNVLTIHGGEFEEESINIDELTSKKLVLSFEEEDEDFGVMKEVLEFKRI